MVSKNVRLLLNDELDIEHNRTIIAQLFSKRRDAILQKNWVDVNNIDIAIATYLSNLAASLMRNTRTIMNTSDAIRNGFSDQLSIELANQAQHIHHLG